MSVRQDSLFGRGEMAPTKPAAKVAVQRSVAQQLPLGGRAPTAGEHVCVCGCAAVYGLGEAWFCVRCVPPDFLPANRR